MQQVRTRFAPSPTGFMHVGNLRTALYAWLLARSRGGRFILRIEDTDQARYVENAVEVIYATLAKAGLVHDEGPDKDGGFGPYVQSERKGMYRQYAEQLVESGAAYYCFCDKCEEESEGASAAAATLISLLPVPELPPVNPTSSVSVSTAAAKAVSPMRFSVRSSLKTKCWTIRYF